MLQPTAGSADAPGLRVCRGSWGGRGNYRHLRNQSARPASRTRRSIIGRSAMAADAVGGQAHAPARGREQSAEEDRRRPGARQGHAAGCPVKKAVKPDRRRRLVDEVRADWKVSIRRACATFPDRHVALPLQVEARRSGFLESQHQGDYGDAGAGASMYCCAGRDGP